MTDLGFLPGEVETEGNSFAFGINNNDIVAGYSIEIFEETDDLGLNLRTDTAVYYDSNNLTVNKIPQFVPETPSDARALAINDNNLVVGYGTFDPLDDQDNDGEPIVQLLNRGLFYNIDTGELIMVEPFSEDDFQQMTLRAVNNDGYAVGISTETVDGFGTNQLVAVDVNTPEIVEKIEVFGGTVQQPWAVNIAKNIVGSARTEDRTTIEAFLYENDSQTVTALGFLNDNFRYSEAFDINDSDQIVGISQVQNSPNVFHGFLYENGIIKDLDKLIGCNTGWRITEARAINDSGVITGTGLVNGQKHAFMLMPLNGTAPNCDDDDDSSSDSSGSIPVFGLVLLGMLGLNRRRK